MKGTPTTLRTLRQRGQGLVETALFLPIFVIILAGLVEVSQLVVDQNRVSHAARNGARYLAQGGDDHSMAAVALHTMTQTRSLAESDWDIWAIRATVNISGNGFDRWDFEHVYGLANTARFSDVIESQVQAQVLAELQKNVGASSVAGLNIVATQIIHDVPSILGLDAIPWLTGMLSTDALSVMRVLTWKFDTSLGCDAFPIAIHEEIISASPPGSATDAYPDKADFGIGSPTPNYGSFVASGHQPRVYLRDIPDDAYEPGLVFKIQNGYGNGNFGWLRWNIGRPDDSNTLVDSLRWPGNSIDYTTEANGGSGLPGSGLPYNGRVYGYVEPNDVTDQAMHVGDWVAATTGAINAAQVRFELQNLINNDRYMRLIVYDQAVDQGNYGEYRIKRFAIFRLHGYNLVSGTSWILAEFIQWSDFCGNP